MRMTVRRGDRLRCREDIPTDGLTHWKAPYTLSFECVIPAGTILVVDCDPVAGATGFGCVPEDYEGFEQQHVPDREAWRYGGYSFVMDLDDIGKRLEKINAKKV